MQIRVKKIENLVILCNPSQNRVMVGLILFNSSSDFYPLLLLQLRGPETASRRRVTARIGTKFDGQWPLNLYLMLL